MLRKPAARPISATRSNTAITSQRPSRPLLTTASTTAYSLGNGYAPAYVPGYNFVNACGWKVITCKNWNPAHTQLTIVKNKVWTCY